MDSNKSTWQSLVDTYHTAENFLADMPIAKAIGGVIANPTPQEVGAQVAGLGKAISESAQKATENPVEAAITYTPVGTINRIPKISSWIDKIPQINKSIPYTGSYPAIRTKDGDFIVFKNYETHVEGIKKFEIPYNEIESGGWINEGLYNPTDASDTMRYVDLMKIRESVAKKRLERINAEKFLGK